MTGISEWVFEGVLQYLRSPLWTSPVHGFIEKHCHEFVAGEEENKLVYTQLHNEFRTLIDDLLSSFLEELGVSGESFVDAIKAGENEELSGMIAEFLYALDDFPSFRALMEKKNLELELEAMYEYARVAGHQPNHDDDDDMTDEERFLMEMAIQLSLGQADITLKRLEKEDAELLQALALSVAVEQERLVRQQIREDGGGNSAEATPPPPPPAEVQPSRSAQQISDEVRQQRAFNVERVLFELAAQQQQQTSQSNTSGPAVIHSSLAPIAPSADAQRIVHQSLAPVGERRGVFGAKGTALPGISGSATFMPSSSAPLPPQPSFQELKAQAEAKIQANSGSSSSKDAEPSKEELEQRAAYFKAQRERLLQQKATAREKELEQYKKEQNQTDAPPPPAVGGDASAEADATREMRLALARRFREDLIQETRRTS